MMLAYPFAAMMLLAWPFITAVIFARLDRANAFIWSILLAYLFLPPGLTIDLPAVPGLAKEQIASLSALLMLSLGGKRNSDDLDPLAADAPPRIPSTVRFLLLGVFASAAMTGMTNGDSLIEGVTFRPGMDAAMVAGNLFLQAIEFIPFFVAFRLLSTPHQTRKLLVALLFCLLIYSIPMLLEVRLSPQLNIWIYGYFQHDFLQAIRYNGFRPLVFLSHPIWVASFATAGFLATVCLARAFPSGLRMTLVLFYMLGVLILCKTMTAVLMAAMAAPLIMMASPRHILSVSAIIALTVITYPVLRLVEFVPTEQIIDFLEPRQPERAQSLGFRFDNEFILLERAMERPLWGWGGWGRNFPLNPENGRTMAIADGYWVIVYGTRGIIGYLFYFGLLIAPVLILWRRRYELMLRHENSGSLMAASVGLLMAVNLIELIPNATITPLTWLFNGVVLGHASRLVYTRDARKRWKKRREELEEEMAAQMAF